jgi:hypothetical protein
MEVADCGRSVETDDGNREQQDKASLMIITNSESWKPARLQRGKAAQFLNRYAFGSCGFTVLGKYLNS